MIICSDQIRLHKPLVQKYLPELIWRNNPDSAEGYIPHNTYLAQHMAQNERWEHGIGIAYEWDWPHPWGMYTLVGYRPGRRMPSQWKIVSYWLDRGEPYVIDPANPHCFRCGIYFDTWPEDATPEERWNKSGLDRSHIVTRSLCGLDLPCNLVPLCRPCHRRAPDCTVEDAERGIAYHKPLAGQRRKSSLPERFSRRYGHDSAKG